LALRKRARRKRVKRRIHTIDLKTLIPLIAVIASVTGLLMNVVGGWLATPTSDFDVSVADVRGVAQPNGCNSTTINVEGQSTIGRPYSGGNVSLSVSTDNVRMQRYFSTRFTNETGHPPFQS